jgi:uncharacterized protein
VIDSLTRAWTHWRGRRVGDFIWTSSGRRFWPFDPRPDEIDIRDIARGVATECRYSGQIGFHTGFVFYSVAEHSVIVSIYAERRARALGLAEWEVWDWALEGLLHDGSEAYIGDVSRPVKHTRSFRAYRQSERLIEHAIAARFALRPTAQSTREIKILDNRVLIDEMDAFMNLSEGDTLEGQIAKFGEPLGVNIVGLSPEHAEHVFLQRYAEIVKAQGY